jgi:hypothetical protein
MSNIKLLLERLQDREISQEAKCVIVRELDELGVKTVKCIYKPNLKGRLDAYTVGDSYIVSRETLKSIWVFDKLGIERRFTKGGYEAAKTGMLDYDDRVLVAL